MGDLAYEYSGRILMVGKGERRKGEGKRRLTWSEPVMPKTMSRCCLALCSTTATCTPAKC